ncbi:protein phosphatase [Angomonas deanei]|nr:protein phosphatase [Angomonas deanei]|eukprot:EPY43314.1 protein phosphatase [Angomonas deanei]
MEDQHIMLAEGIPFFGVYDGHGGTACAEYLRDNLHTWILSHAEVRTNPEKAIFDSIVEADRKFLSETDETSNESGCVCAVVLVLEDKLVIGNVGDTEAILCRSGKPILLTTKHNLSSNPDELERVRGVGGRIFQNRVGHPKFNPSVISLAVTRAIGDAGYKLDEYTDGKPSGVIAEPSTKTVQLTNEDEYVVIGCDGLWDVMTYEDVTKFCCERLKSNQNAQSVAEELVRAALNNGSNDNVTAMLVRLNRGVNRNSHEFLPEAAVSTSSRNLTDYS